MLKIVRILNDEGIASPRGKLWNKPTVHNILRNEAYLGTLVWGNNAKDNADPVRVEKAFPAVVTKAQFDRVNTIMRSRAPQGLPPPQSRKHLPTERPGQVLQVQEGALGPLLQQGHVPLLCVPLLRKARARVLRLAQGRRPEVRGAGRRLDSLQHPDRGQHSESGQCRGRADGRRGRRGAQAAGDHRVGACRRAGQARPAYDLVETTTEFNMADFAHRIRDHKERQQRLESAAEGARAILAQRRAVLDDVKTITAYAQDMNRFLQKSELTERRAFIETFVREIELLPDNAVVRYTVPMPDDSLIPGEKAQEIPLNGSVVSSVKVSPPTCTELRTGPWRATSAASPPPIGLSGGVGMV